MDVLVLADQPGLADTGYSLENRLGAMDDRERERERERERVREIHASSVT